MVLIQNLTVQHIPRVRCDELELEVVPVFEQQLGESVHRVIAPSEVGFWLVKERIEALKMARSTLNDYDYTFIKIG